MQRTVYSTKFTYVENEVIETEKGIEIASTLKTIIIHDSDPKKALKQAIKENGLFAPIKTEKIANLYILDDEIFFKYAKIVENPETTNATENPNTQQ